MKTPLSSIEINARFQQALDVMENSSRSVFITGRAGTGKSTLLSYFRSKTAKKVAVLAPTGVAALNVQGQTIHSFFGFKPNITLQLIKRPRFKNDEDNIYKKLDAIVIDEISMVRADLLDCVDKFLRINGPARNLPFGGIQMIFIGDLYQLPPVVTGIEKAGFDTLYATPYFYSARVFENMDMELIELEKIYRQHDAEFIQLLNSIRNKSVTDQSLELLNRRYDPDFEPSKDDFYIYLTTTNALAEQINRMQMDKLRTKLYSFPADIQGNFGHEYLPTTTELQVKVGAQIMLVNNDIEGRWVNGTIGEITAIVPDKKDDQVIIAELAEGETIEITPHTWEIFNFFVEGGQLQSEVVGKFTQYPVILAWAVTIHKSQGKTFDKVIIDIGRGTFTHGQMYVALSRCTTLEGIVLKKPVLKKHILMDWKVVDFLTKYQYKKAEQRLSLDDKLAMIKKAINNKTALEIVYLKPNDEKSSRTVQPQTVGEMEYQGKTYTGMRAFCLKRCEDRTFRVDRILDMKEVQK
jgi:ATP-dependent DNA helicase PIF1